MPSSTDHPSIQPRWDGRLLELDAPAGRRIGIALDGLRFTELLADANGHCRLELPFSPSGRTALQIGISALDEPAGLATPVFSIQMGRAGMLPDTELPTLAQEPQPIGNWLPADAYPMQPEVAIIVPVYNAMEATKRCLDSVLANSSGNCRLIVIDDASTDAGIAPMLAGYRGLPGVEIHANPINLGFTATVNRGMSLAGTADVVLLNADTEVGSQWLTGLRRAVSSAADVATATAVSNNAGAFSVPELERENPLPTQWTFAQTARAHWQAAGHAFPQLPTGNGFCMYIRRSVLDQVGLFDVKAFPQGYGEENDFCQRACAAGYRNVIAGNVFVLHARSQSFGVDRREALGRAGMQVLRERWPDYESDVGRQLFSFERRVLDWRVRCLHAMAVEYLPLPRLLRFAVQADCSPMSSYDIRELSVKEHRLSLDGNPVWDRRASTPLTDNPAGVSGLLQDLAIELLEIEQGMDPGLTEALLGQADRLGIPVLSLTAGESASFARRETARHALNRFERIAR